MGGHGGLNILPQKRWNVYRQDNRERVRRDEEAAAREEQVRLQASRRRDSELRLDLLRRSRGIAEPAAVDHPATDDVADEVGEVEDSRHINFFGSGLAKDFGLLGSEDGKRGAGRRNEEQKSNPNPNSNKRKRKEEEIKVVGPEEEKCRLGYGVAGKGVAAPWYMVRPSNSDSAKKEVEECDGNYERASSQGKKSIEELRMERMKREGKEKEREKAVIAAAEAAKRRKGSDRGFPARRRG